MRVNISHAHYKSVSEKKNKTDPAKMDYVIVEGARRVEQRWDPTENGQIVPDDKQVVKTPDDGRAQLCWSFPNFNLNFGSGRHFADNAIYE